MFALSVARPPGYLSGSPTKEPPLPIAPRLLTEQLFHDRQAAERADRFADVKSLRFRDADYLDHEPWIRPAFDRLRDLRGQQVLDYGCGHGMASVVLARRGAVVTGIDLSPGYIDEARRRAAANEVAAEFVPADAESLPFADRSFDAVWGCAILHHLDLRTVGAELHRVLRPAGVAVFCEPWGGNPLIELARRCLPYPGKHRTPGERPLRPVDLALLREHFPRVEVHGYQLLGAARRLLRRESRAGGWLDRVDTRMLRRWPVLEKWCRYVVLTLVRG
jgi:SAM-dependent methyltransferase